MTEDDFEKSDLRLGKKAMMKLPEDKLPGMHSVPKSAVLPYASGVGGLSRRLLHSIGHIVV